MQRGLSPSSRLMRISFAEVLLWAAEEPRRGGQDPDLPEHDQKQDRATKGQQALVGRRDGTSYVHRSDAAGEAAERECAERALGPPQDRRRRGSRRGVSNDRAMGSRSGRGGLAASRRRRGLGGRGRRCRSRRLRLRDRSHVAGGCDGGGWLRRRLRCRVGCRLPHLRRRRVRAAGNCRCRKGREEDNAHDKDERPAAPNPLKAVRPSLFHLPSPGGQRDAPLSGLIVSNTATVWLRAAAAAARCVGTSCSRTKSRGSRDRRARRASRAAASPGCSWPAGRTAPPRAPGERRERASARSNHGVPPARQAPFEPKTGPVSRDVGRPMRD
jgi:hypothetical protein